MTNVNGADVNIPLAITNITTNGNAGVVNASLDSHQCDDD